MSVVRVSWPSAWTCFGIMMAGLLTAGGCTPPKKTLPQPPATQPSSLGAADALTRRVQELSHGADALQSDATQLPGADRAEHIKIMQRVFSDLLLTLPLLANTTDDPSLRQLLAIVQTSRAQLGSAPADLKVDPIIDNGLRAVTTALTDISRGDDYREEAAADLGKNLDALSARLNLLDQERNPSLHRIDVAEVVEQTSRVVSGLAASVGRHIAAQQKPPAAPTTEPATAPTAPPSAGPG